MIRLSYLPICAAMALVAAHSALAQNLIPLPAVDGQINDMLVSGNTLYIGGSFTMVGSAARNGLAAIDLTTGMATSWDPFGTETANVSSLSLGASGEIFVGGSFTSIGGATRLNVGAVNLATGTATAWNAGIDNGTRVAGVRATGNGTAFLWGDFTSLQSTGRTSGLAAVDADGNLTAFDPVVADASGLVNNYRDLAISEPNGKVFLAYGNSSATWNVGGTDSRRGMVELDMSSGLATGFNLRPQEAAFGAGVFGLAVNADDLYIGGGFNNVFSENPNVDPGIARQKLAKIDITTGMLDTAFAPTALTGADSGVRHMEYSGGVLYAIGDFNSYGSEGRKGVAAINSATGDLIVNWNVTTGESFERFSGTPARMTASEAGVFLASANMSDWTVLDDPGHDFYVGVTPVAVPEPGSIGMLLGLGLLALGAKRISRRGNRTQ